MKLLTYDDGAGTRAGVLLDEARVADAATLLGIVGPLRDVRALLETGPDALDRLREALDRQSPAGTPLADVRLRAPILQPPTVRDFIAFEEHATGQWTRPSDGPRMDAWRRMPLFYFSNPLRIYGPDELVPFPRAARQLDYECELAVVVARDGSNLREAEANRYIAGFTIFNDWSSRDLQFDESVFGLGPAKGKDSASSLGPWIVTPDELGDRYRDGTLHVRCQLRVNGVPWLEGHGGNMYHTFGAMLERAAQDSRIAAGDVLASGTVGGGSISEAVRKGFPARWLQVGDVVEVEVEGIGTLRNTLGESSNPHGELRWTAPRLGELPDPLSAAELDAIRARTAPDR